MAVIILQYINASNKQVVHFNLHNIICQLHLNKAGEKKNFKNSNYDKDTIRMLANSTEFHLFCFIETCKYYL